MGSSSENAQSLSDMMKKVEANKSSVPRGQMYLKHLSPMHNLKAAKNFDIVSFLIVIVVETTKLSDQTLLRAS
jgi:hypothetical protein